MFTKRKYSCFHGTQLRWEENLSDDFEGCVRWRAAMRRNRCDSFIDIATGVYCTCRVSHHDHAES